MGVAKMEKQQRKQSYIEKRLSVRIRRSKLLQQTENIEYKIATTTDELEQAFELVTQQYISVGMHLKEHELRLTKYHLLPDSKVFIAIKKLPDNKEKVIGTLTVVVDTSMGLPMDEIYKEQLDRIRITGVLLAEVIGLAVTPAESALQNNIVMYLFKMCFQYARFSQVHDLLCSVKQKHVAFYSEVLLFKAIGEAFPYSYANGQLIQGHQLNLFQANKDFENVYRRIKILKTSIVVWSLMPTCTDFSLQKQKSTTGLTEKVTPCHLSRCVILLKKKLSYLAAFQIRTEVY